MRVISVGECMVEFHRRDDGLWQQGFAGDTLNVAWAMRALAGPDVSVAYLTRIGTDGLSEAMAGFLADAGIATDLIVRQPGAMPGLYTIETDAAGERRFAYWRSASAARHLADDADRLAAAFASADIVYLSGITLAILAPDRRQALTDALGTRGRRPFRVAVDPNIRPVLWESAAAMRTALTALAGAADIVLPSFDDEASAFGDRTPGETLRRYAALGPDEVIVKNGPQPTLFRASGASGSCAVPPVTAVSDTTGAGDSFNGGYLAARLAGMPAAAAVGVAQAVSGAVIGRRGALIAAAEISLAAKAGGLR